MFLRALSRWQAENEQDGIADMSVEAYRGAAGEEFHDRANFLRRFALDTERPGFDMVLATEENRVGCVYGSAVDREGTRWRGFVGDLPRELEELTAMGKVFAVDRLMVLPDHRRRGVATELVEHLLARCDATVATALVDPANIPAHEVFTNWGWTRAGSLHPDAVGPVYDLWTHPLAP